jgi:cobalt/nickel transport system permease protein
VTAGHGHGLHFPGDSPVHRARPERKLVALVGFVLVVVATPSDWYAAFAGYLALLLAVVAVSRVPVGRLARGMVVEVPFLVFAAVLPLVSRGPEVGVLGVSVSRPGTVAAAGLVMKGTLGVLASLTLASTTEPRALLVGLERLRMPVQMVQILGFMVRYLDVVGDELRRMRLAMAARGFTPRNPAHWPALARSAGTLFIRCYERGERVHLAMLSRGYTGRSPR